jgi:hypothetical protein
MSPQQLQDFNDMKKRLAAIERVENVSFIESLNRRLNFLSGSFRLSDASDVSSTTPTSGQVLKYNGTEWAPGTDNVI